MFFFSRIVFLFCCFCLGLVAESRASNWAVTDNLVIADLPFGSVFRGTRQIVSQSRSPRTNPPAALVEPLHLFGRHVIRRGEDGSGLVPELTRNDIHVFFAPESLRVWGMIFETAEPVVPEEYTRQLFRQVKHLYGGNLYFEEEKNTRQSGTGRKKTETPKGSLRWRVKASSRKKKSQELFLGNGPLAAALEEFLEEVRETGTERSGGWLTEDRNLLVVVYALPLQKKPDRDVKRRRNLSILFIDLQHFREACREL